MASKKARRWSRHRKIECLEERHVMAVDVIGNDESLPFERDVAVVDVPAPPAEEAPKVEHHGALDDGPAQKNPDANFWLDRNAEHGVASLLGEIEQTLAQAHGQTGLTQVRNNYGFLGTGQTVAIIDSGIAWDHPALGGGVGANYRIVGGWDFAEGDANFYDDAPEGAHGTHVSGIVGGDRVGTIDDGVAPGVDLVGLRVFNDAGDGYFSWVESALQFVHQYRNHFENPITAVNLSLGSTWNATTVPSWSTLEDEFALLKADGIFVSVSAGNSFTSYNVPGLSYPAASPNVVPVMSVDDNGALSYFSQRHPIAIAAPGRFIVSTVPDYIGNHNGVTDDYASFSGTSMAAPYVAGASVILREAMQFLGYTNITQTTLFNHMMATADTFFDSATNQNYKKLNVNSAIAALMPSDDYGSTSGTAYNLGSVSGNRAIAGLIGTLTDVDFFTFTAGATGTATLNVTGTHYLVPNVTVTGSTATFANGTWSFNVVAGQSYTFSLQTAAGQGIGYFNGSVNVQGATPAPVVVKTAVRQDGTVFSLDSEGWLSMNGTKVWSSTRDFSLLADGTLHWFSTSGHLARWMPDLSWKFISNNVTKFAISNTGVAYSLATDGWVSIDGQKVWQNTADFALSAQQTLFWQDTNGHVYRRPNNGSWTLVDTNVQKFVLQSNEVAYCLAADDWVRVNGSLVWENTHDLAISEDQTVYWHSTSGQLFRRPSGGSWQLLGNNVNQFAIGQNGTVYVLFTNGNVTANGVGIQSAVTNMQINTLGNLVLQRSIGSPQEIGGRFIVGSNWNFGGNSVPQSIAAGSTTNGISTAAVSLVDAAFHSVGREFGKSSNYRQPRGELVCVDSSVTRLESTLLSELVSLRTTISNLYDGEKDEALTVGGDMDALADQALFTSLDLWTTSSTTGQTPIGDALDLVDEAYDYLFEQVGAN